ncbi:hypothetical protein EYC98_01795 [Halieaceae bacterium IMCC14734]|uniref:Uncharacterized protein n=1 Tax=Candidatus Litorirhabdus singularis TaxID=2518993 RepID=A0ABT3TDR9_9GAMM|nr:hypothetical protein [Candidatus Litorirhabdus singularis]MCX2979589.1 hypothetical protein [Candidatus Litorirhabdus singularis]
MSSIPRKSLFPSAGDSWEIIAERELGGGGEEAVGQLQSWNLHVFMRPPAAPGSPHEHNPILPSDVIFLEPPQAA